eukprot:m.83397 g.83397  ORF g.83397 m.83397 type:complete len:137 (+) comp12721_c0_seq8:502-912(+)
MMSFMMNLLFMFVQVFELHCSVFGLILDSFASAFINGLVCLPFNMTLCGCTLLLLLSCVFDPVGLTPLRHTLKAWDTSWMVYIIGGKAKCSRRMALEFCFKFKLWLTPMLSSAGKTWYLGVVVFLFYFYFHLFLLE